ncbi:FAD-binding protein [Streptomyces sp. NPDC087440]|uniref:FAD-binding protein n=1 Tax=Streptomyces sp. NPDC087440 TaxID=3365790 RepID=UPI00380E5108
MSDLPGTTRPSSAAPWDLLVVGCGAGGLAAAVGFAENAPGGRVLVLERSSRYLRGWSTARTRSSLPPPGPAEGLGCRPHEPTEGLGDAEHIAVLCAHAEPTVRWLADRHGVPFETCGASLVDGLARSLELLGGSIRYGARATGLSTDGLGTVNGVYVQQDGRTRHVAARHTVLASGGFQGSPDLLERHIGATAGELPVSTPGGRNSTGDGIEMAVAVGAARGGRYDRFHGEPVDPRSHPTGALILAYPYGILVDADGRRFVDEGADTPENTFGDVAFSIWREARQSAYLICDAKILRVDGHERLLVRDQNPITAPTIAELARRLDLAPDELTRTVDRFNAACRPTAPYDPTRPDGRHTVDLVPPKSNWALALDAGPFMAWPVHCAIAFTFGGLRTDARSRVLTGRNEPLEGLYAVGETAGLHCGRCAGATSALRALTFGRLAGAEIARAQNSADPAPPPSPSP